MKKLLFVILSGLVLSFVAVSSTLAQEAEKPKEAPAGKEAAAAEKPKAELAKAETISGTLQMVAADKKIVVLTDSAGTPFNFKVTGATQIKVAGKKAKLDELASQTNKGASVKFLPTRSGNVARSIEIGQ
jgi:ABC-type amino acid transport substrate-binding protein